MIFIDKLYGNQQQKNNIHWVKKLYSLLERKTKNFELCMLYTLRFLAVQLIIVENIIGKNLHLFLPNKNS